MDECIVEGGKNVTNAKNEFSFFNVGWTERLFDNSGFLCGFLGLIIRNMREKLD